MSSQVHYEVFRRHGSKGGWTLLDVVTRREDALKMAQTLLDDGKATGVKVVKETYNDTTGDYLTLKIFETGHNSVKIKPSAEDVPNAIPCFKPDDLYSYHARATINRVLFEYLAREGITVTELIHRADALERFEAASTFYQHAVQKVAVAQAADSNVAVQEIVRRLDGLATKAIERVYRDSRRNYFPQITPDSAGALAAAMAKETDGLYRLNGAIAVYLASGGGWSEKLRRLLELAGPATEVTSGRTLLLSSIDGVASEVFSNPAAIKDIASSGLELGPMLVLLVELFLGEAPCDPALAPIAMLAGRLKADELPATRTAIGRRILAEIKSVKRLSPESLADEVKMLRQIANRLVLGVGKYLSQADLIAAFTMRSRRLVAFDSLSQHIEDVASPEERVSRILALEENIIGPENKRQLASFLGPLILSGNFQRHFLDSKLAPLTSLNQLSALQSQLGRSGIADPARAELIGALDRIACEVEDRAKILETLDANVPNIVDRALALLELMHCGALTEGRLAQKAREKLTACISKPAFVPFYLAQKSNGQAAEIAMAELIERLTQAGVTVDSRMKLIAA
jgi:hypothetical protein